MYAYHFECRLSHNDAWTRVSLATLEELKNEIVYRVFMGWECRRGDNNEHLEMEI